MRNKIKMDKMKLGYMKIPSKTFHMELSIYAIAVYTSLFTVTEDFNPSITYVQRLTGIGRSSVVKAFKELEKKNMINKIETGSIRRVNKYAFVEPKNWKKYEDKASQTKTKKASSN